MNALVELIKRIGIFMIAAQVVIHFAPDRKYAKYMKLIAGVMILLQFLSPIYEIVCGATMNWSEQLSNMEQEFNADVFSETFATSDSALETVANSIEREIKSKLNNELDNELYDELSGGDSGCSYMVTSVRVSLEKSDAKDENDVEYTLDKIDVAVWRHREDGSDTDRIEKVQVDKISIAKDEMEGNENAAAVGDEQEAGDSLRRRFCNVLGIDEKYMEVRIYGAH